MRVEWWINCSSFSLGFAKFWEQSLLLADNRSLSVYELSLQLNTPPLDWKLCFNGSALCVSVHTTCNRFKRFVIFGTALFLWERERNFVNEQAPEGCVDGEFGWRKPGSHLAWQCSAYCDSAPFTCSELNLFPVNGENNPHNIAWSCSGLSMGEKSQEHEWFLPQRLHMIMIKAWLESNCSLIS